MRKLKLWTTGALVGGLALALLAIGNFSPTAKAQVPSASPPYNIDLGVLITNTARAANTTANSAQQSNLANTGAMCTFNQTATTGTLPGVTINIQNFDSASGLYYTVATSAALSPTTNTPITVFTHDGAQTSSLPSNIFASGIPLARYWRVQQLYAQSSGTPTTTGTVNCVLLK